MDKIPCRVSADLRKYMREQEQYVPVEFDWSDEAHMKAIFGQSQWSLIKPIHGLLDSYHYIDRVQRSFGEQTLDKDKALQMLMDDLLRLREACAILFAEER